MQINLPQKVKIVIETLQNAGYEAYAVGGCVRDSLLSRTPMDWDITTSAKPEQVKALFRRTIDTGIQHGTVTVMMGKEGFEVTTYRIDGAYEDHRHPKEVFFTNQLVEDLRRRDFTINAMAYSERTGLVDEFHGIEDMKRHIIRAVGEARERFSEDALRILRAFRFGAQLDFTIEEKTRQAAVELVQTLEKISAERIQVELVKLLTSMHPERVQDLYEANVLQVILPEVHEMFLMQQNNPHHCYSVGEHTVKALLASTEQGTHLDDNQKKVLRIALFLHDTGKVVTKTTDERGIDHFYGHPSESEVIAKRILRALKFDNDTLNKVTKLILLHDYNPKLTFTSVRRSIVKITSELMPVFFALKRSDILGQSDYHRTEKLHYIDEFEKMYEKIIRDGDCISIKNLAVNGKDLIDAGMKPGKDMGDLLSLMFEHVLEEPSHNTKEYLLSKFMR